MNRENNALSSVKRYTVAHKLLTGKEIYLKSDGTFGEVAEQSNLMLFSNYALADVYMLAHCLFTDYYVINAEQVSYNPNLTKKDLVKTDLMQDFTELVTKSNKGNVLALDFTLANFENGKRHVSKIAGATINNQQVKANIFDPINMSYKQQIDYLKNADCSYKDAVINANFSLLQGNLKDWIKLNKVKLILVWLDQDDLDTVSKEKWLTVQSDTAIINLAQVFAPYLTDNTAQSLLKMLGITVNCDLDLQTACGLIRLYKLFRTINLDNHLHTYAGSVTILQSNQSKKSESDFGVDWGWGTVDYGLQKEPKDKLKDNQPRA